MALQVTNGPAPARSGQIFWRGADGNIYLKGAGGDGAAVSNLGSNVATWDLVLNGAREIDNPGNNLGGGGGGGTDIRSMGGGGGGGGAAAPTYKDTTAARNATGVSLGSLETIMNNALAGADAEYGSVIDAYNAEDAENLTRYKGDVETNEISRDGNTQAALLGAARGSRGLYATLASLGALGGTGRTLANRSIATEANADLGAGEKSFETNASTLFDARSSLEKQEKQRRLDAEKIRNDSKRNAEYDFLKGNQDLSKEMAGLWTEAGNTGEAANWISRASSYTTPMAEKTKVNVGQYAKTPLAYSKPELGKYLGGMNSTAVNVAKDSPINGALYTSSKQKDKELV
jgi:hypothetical protein